jgi:hypothetical protein
MQQASWLLITVISIRQTSEKRDEIKKNQAQTLQRGPIQGKMKTNCVAYY